jgi:glycosyltransferase involved in cell wall biosynthesis
MINIAIVGSFHFPFGDAAGARYRLLALALKKLGVKVHIISQLPYIPRQEDFCVNGCYQYKGIPYYSALVETTFQKSYLKSSLNIIKGSVNSAKLLSTIIKREEIDIIFFDGNFNIHLLPILKIARQKGIPIVNDVMEWFSNFVFFGGIFHPLAWDHEICMRITNKQLNGLVVISTYLLEYYKNRSKIDPILIPAIGEFSNGPPSWPQNDIFRIGYFGRPTEKDGIYDLIRAIEILAHKKKDFEFFLAGDDGRAGNLLKIKKQVSSDPCLKKRIRFLGQIKQNMIPSVFAQCNTLVLSRPLERFSLAGFPQKLPEYMALGRPVIVTDVGDIPLYVRDGIDGFVVKPGNPVAFANAIDEIMRLSDYGFKMGVSAWERGKSVFDSNLNAERLLRYFLSLINK